MSDPDAVWKEMARKMKIGDRVVRGKDWTYGDEDRNGPGTISEIFSDKSLKVRWDWEGCQETGKMHLCAIVAPLCSIHRMRHVKFHIAYFLE